jgi:hypothetical protein
MRKKRKHNPRLEVAIVASSAVREAFGFPCFFCGVPLAQCRKRKCCKKCKPNEGSHK